LFYQFFACCFVFSHTQLNSCFFFACLCFAALLFNHTRPGDRHGGRCNVLLSATVGEDVKAIAALSLKQPEIIRVSTDHDPVIAAAAAAARVAGGGAGSTGGVDPAAPLALGDSGDAATAQFAVSSRLQQHHVTLPAKLRLVCVLVSAVEGRAKRGGQGSGVLPQSGLDQIPRAVAQEAWWTSGIQRLCRCVIIIAWQRRCV